MNKDTYKLISAHSLLDLINELNIIDIEESEEFEPVGSVIVIPDVNRVNEYSLILRKKARRNL